MIMTMMKEIEVLPEGDKERDQDYDYNDDDDSDDSGSSNDDFDPTPMIVLSPTGDTQDTFDSSHVDNTNDNENGSGSDGQHFRQQQKQQLLQQHPFRKPQNSTPKQRPPSSASTTTKTSAKKKSYSINEHYWEAVLYISLSAMLGSVIRAYMERLFGEDCEKYNEQNETLVEDFLTPLSKNICVTAGGKTSQTGGALFYELPSNMLGCFVMGMITPPSPSSPPPTSSSSSSRRHRSGTKQQQQQQQTRVPWFHSSHPLQDDEVYHSSIGTGFCGCLTTFASWNTQMVVMLDGYATLLKPPQQVMTVLFGYLLGLMCSIISFYLGRHFGRCLYLWKHPELENEEDEQEAETDVERQQLTAPKEGQGEEQMMTNFDTGDHHGQEVELVVQDVGHDGDHMDDDTTDESKHHASSQEPSSEVDTRLSSHLLVEDEIQDVAATQIHKLPLVILTIGLIVGFGFGGIQQDIEWYRGMLLMCCLSPPGALVRWKLADWNIPSNRLAMASSADRSVCGCSGGGGGGLLQCCFKNVPDWLPIGTVVANLVAVVIGCIATGLDDRYFSTTSTASSPWIRGLFYAINSGLAGSMSTVSTMIKETVILSEQSQTGRMIGLGKPYYYSIGTCLAGMLLGLCVYATTVRA
mmetsp:Transcript_1726/g.3939  ORF Transcript_1726/g.3939 Transcript_1726/m.3939 type:complete len:636 (-) Transcript_1726:923-2830(-)